MYPAGYLIAILAVVIQHAEFSSACIECFVEDKMDKYSTWLQDNNLDPSPPINQSLFFSQSNVILNVESELSGMVMENYAKDIREISGAGDLLEGFLRVDMTFDSNVTLSGTHETNGTLLSTTPLSGGGEFRITIFPIWAPSLYIYFEPTPTGFLNVTNYDLQYISWSEENVQEVYFEGISDNDAAQGYEDYVKTALSQGVEAVFRRNSGIDPIQSPFLKYWQEELGKTTLADIIGSTRPPTTTNEPVTETDPGESTIGISDSTTENPCVRPNTQIVSEEVIEIREETDDEGFPVVLTKTVTVTVTKHRKEL